MTDIVEVGGTTGVVVDVQGDSSVDVVDVVSTGPPGPIGPTGPQGPEGERGEGNAFTFTQSVPATVWTITHDLEYDPGGILVVSEDGFVMDGFGVQVLVPGVSLRLSFDISFAGVAYLS